MTLEEQAALMSDGQFRKRCKAAMLFYANDIMDQAPNTPSSIAIGQEGEGN